MRPQQQGLLSLVLPLLASGQSLVTGDPPANGAGPYGIPEDKFRQALSSSEVSAASYPVPGYRVDAPSTDGNASGSDLQDDSWRLGIDVYANVPLRDVPRASDADKGKYARVTTVSLGHSPAVDMGASWRLCATVYLGLAAAAADASKKQAGNDDGTCAQLLPSDCLKQLQVQAESRGIGADGTCSTPGVPPKCEEHIVGNGTAFAIPAGQISQRNLFAYASAPGGRDDRGEIARAMGNVWPVVITWAQADAAGKELRFANAHTACLRANQTTGGGGGGNGTDAGGGGSGKSGAVAVVPARPVVGVVCWSVLVAAGAYYLL